MRYVGLVVMLVGFVLATGLVQLSEISYVDVWYSWWPDGTSSSPNHLNTGATVVVWCDLVYDDPSGFYIDPNDYTVTVTVSKDGSTVATLNLVYTSSYPDGELHIAHFEKQWTVPTEGDVLYQFYWEVTAPGAGTSTKTTYGKTDPTPDGTWYINNVASSETASHSLISPTFTVKFVPTQQADAITNVYIKVFDQGTNTQVSGSPMSLTKQGDGSWTGTFTLPYEGAFRCEGWIDWTGGVDVRLMSIVAVYGVETETFERPSVGPTPSPSPSPSPSIETPEGVPLLGLSQTQFIGVLLIVLGFVMYRRGRAE